VTEGEPRYVLCALDLGLEIASGGAVSGDLLLGPVKLDLFAR
jgi:hypothetical protein